MVPSAGDKTKTWFFKSKASSVFNLNNYLLLVISSAWDLSNTWFLDTTANSAGIVEEETVGCQNQDYIIYMTLYIIHSNFVYIIMYNSVYIVKLKHFIYNIGYYV